MKPHSTAVVMSREEAIEQSRTLTIILEAENHPWVCTAGLWLG